MQRFKKILIALLVITINSRSSAEVTPAALFSDHMVLTQNTQAPIWGKAAPGEKVTVAGSWHRPEERSTIADPNGNWMIKLRTPGAGGPYTLMIKGTNLIEINDLMIGEVWLCSGQSNMAWPVFKDKDSHAIITNSAKYKNIRLFKVAMPPSDNPLGTIVGNWQISGSDSVKEFSAVGYHFGKELNRKLNVPIGLIHSACGGTPVEAWTDERSMPRDEELLKLVAGWKTRKRDAERPGNLYDRMIVPLIPYAIRGVIWYQGEFNARNYAQLYKKQFPAMIRNWRTAFEQPDMPFYFVQIAPFKYVDRPANAPQLVREGQLLTTKNVANTGMVVVTDLVNDINDGHPPAKESVGKRLALLALSKTYGKNVICSGPVYKSMNIEGSKIRIFFDYADKGMVSLNGDVTDFEVAGSERNFYPAKAVIDSNCILASSDKVKEPVAVRFGWSKAPQPNLFNKEGLPASPFRTDNWPLE